MTNLITPDRRQSKTLILSTNVDKKSLGFEFSIAICSPTGDKWQSKTMFLAIFHQRSSIVKSVFDCRIFGVYTEASYVVCVLLYVLFINIYTR